jgi:hypothetical protein
MGSHFKNIHFRVRLEYRPSGVEWAHVWAKEYSHLEFSAKEEIEICNKALNVA